MRLHWKLGKKDHRHQLGTDKILEKIEEAIRVMKPRGNTGGNRNGIDTENSGVFHESKIVIEANEGIGVGIYDERGAVKWGLVGSDYIQISA